MDLIHHVQQGVERRADGVSASVRLYIATPIKGGSLVEVERGLAVEGDRFGSIYHNVVKTRFGGRDQDRFRRMNAMIFLDPGG